MGVNSERRTDIQTDVQLKTIVRNLTKKKKKIKKNKIISKKKFFYIKKN